MFAKLLKNQDGYVFYQSGDKVFVSVFSVMGDRRRYTILYKKLKRAFTRIVCDEKFLNGRRVKYPGGRKVLVASIADLPNLKQYGADVKKLARIMQGRKTLWERMTGIFR